MSFAKMKIRSIGASERFASGWLLAWLLCFRAVIGADVPAKCEICQGPFGESVYVATDPVRQVKKHICEKCSKSRTVCSACGLAANPKTLLKLDDGRILCELDAKGAILSEREARDLFYDVKRDVQGMLAHWPPLPDTNITVFLVSRGDFNKEFEKKPSLDDPEKLLGLTRSRLTEEGNYQHLIYLLSGVLRPQFMATCAHEYTHTWLNERARAARTLNKDTEEGYCELISWKYVSLKNEKLEISRILESDYTRGQVHALIAAEDRYQFYRVIAWIHNGVDSWLDKDRLERLLVLSDDREPDPPAEFAWIKPVSTAVPDTLMLKGISGRTGRRFALINDRTFERNEQGKVRVGNSNVLVRCVEIRDGSIVVQIDGGKELLELFLPGRRKKD